MEGPATSVDAARHEQPYRVLIVDDWPEIRQLLRTRLEVEPDIEVVGEASNGAEGVRLTRALAPSVAVVDLEMPGMSGKEAIPLMRAAAPSMGIVVYTATPDRAVGFPEEAKPDAIVQKGVPLGELIGELRTVLKRAPFDVLRLELGTLPLHQAISAFDTWAGLNVRVLEALERGDEFPSDRLSGTTPEQLQALMGVFAHIGNNLQKAARAGREDVTPVIHVFRSTGVLARDALLTLDEQRLPGFWTAWGYEVPSEAVAALSLMRQRLIEVLPASRGED